MQLITKPEIDLVLEAQKGVARQKVEQKGRYIDKFKIYICLQKFEIANFETLNPKMRFFITYSNSTLSGSTLKAGKTGLSFKAGKVGLFSLQTAKKDFSGFNLQLTENVLQVVTGKATEHCSCPLTQRVGN
ncbi:MULTISPECIES: hypothetical protein [Methanosarcina]|uniref:Uncharacterized protein n=3 Tax=Methanosarcina barkeri TaxID=2208 RepID=A0A0E3LNQ4_METBA|nr:MULTISPECIES: hypothetical protein [Methanosarcina]AKB55176.1 hypothetical protein MSBRM_2178 [Methanosarcina barkeri MS]AKB56747.1 hypothetical protein MSBR2_0231 [Methanosarcina barkeri 227]AKJ37329.1 hypothetical protein MCM1_0212 [Methanosarcina barkeri CM1]OEC92272.1 hypothetical protein A9239_02480 [Methanosarcina sp. A14]